MACLSEYRLLRNVVLFGFLVSRKDKDFQGLVGRANRLHHWKDMISFKSKGLDQYDFGGWYEGRKTRDRLKINQFKEGFRRGEGSSVQHGIESDLARKDLEVDCADSLLTQARG